MKNKATSFIVCLLLLLGCYTCSTSKRTGATCTDGSNSYFTGSGTSVHHGGVVYWHHKYLWDNNIYYDFLRICWCFTVQQHCCFS